MCPKRVFPFKHRHWAQHIWIRMGTKFHLWQIDFLDQICPKRVFLVQNRKNKDHHQIQHIWILLDPKFYRNQTICIFWKKTKKNKTTITTKNSKKVFFIQNRKGEHNHCIQHTLINLDTKFHLKQFLLFWPNLAKKGRKNLVYRK